MIDLTEKSLPNTIEVDGRLYSIYTDFRVWLRFEISLKEHRRDGSVPIGYLFKNDRPLYCNVQALMAFAHPPRELPRAVRGTGSDVTVIDFKLDADLIFAAFLQQYGIDLTTVDELHWHKFLALLHGLKGTKLDEVMAYRCYEKQTDRNIDPHEELRDAWEIREELPEEEEELENFNKLFGGE